MSEESTSSTLKGGKEPQRKRARTSGTEDKAALAAHITACAKAASEPWEGLRVRVARFWQRTGAPLKPGWLNVGLAYPGVTSLTRTAIWYGGLSPLALGPVAHGQHPSLPHTCHSVEHFIRMNEVCPLDTERKELADPDVLDDHASIQELPPPSFAFYTEQKRLYLAKDGLEDERFQHTFVKDNLKELHGKVGKGKEDGQAFLYWIYHVPDEPSPRRFTAVESRYFFAKLYVRTLTKSQDGFFQKLLAWHKKGLKLLLLGQTADPLPTEDDDEDDDASSDEEIFYTTYCARTFRYTYVHVVAALLHFHDCPQKLPWERYRRDNAALYAGIKL